MREEDPKDLRVFHSFYKTRKCFSKDIVTVSNTFNNAYIFVLFSLECLFKHSYS